MSIIEGEIPVSRRDLEDIAKLLVASGNLRTAYEIVRRYTGWGLQEAKEYVNNGFQAVIKEGTLVACKESDKKYYVRAILKRGGEVFYWCEPKGPPGERNTGLSPKTYRTDDITLSLI